MGGYPSLEAGPCHRDGGLGRGRGRGCGSDPKRERHRGADVIDFSCEYEWKAQRMEVDSSQGASSLECDRRGSLLSLLLLSILPHVQLVARCHCQCIALNMKCQGGNRAACTANGRTILNLFVV